VLFVDAIETVVDLVDDPQDIASTTRDVKDDYLVALANAHDAEMIVSRDKDLLEWAVQNPPVVLARVEPDGMIGVAVMPT
jgi:predicted nucleic acid-binding protein